LFSENDLAEIEADAQSKAADAVGFGVASEYPGMDELYRDVFADERDVLL
jgi:TPP-dependent pyruvate/acetoin dehydrogenase alpha subunit